MVRNQLPAQAVNITILLFQIPKKKKKKNEEKHQIVKKKKW